MAGWGSMGGGFAAGLQAGSQAAARAYAAQQEYENQEYIKGQRAEEMQTKAELKAAAAPAQVSDQQGLMVQGQDGKAFYIPADATDAAKAYTDAGYTVGAEPTRYQEATAGGRTLRQAAYTPEHAELGYEPLRGLQEKYDSEKMQRLKDVGIARGRPELAAAYGQLDTQEQQKKLTQAQIDALPEQARLRALQVQRAEREEARSVLAAQAGHLLGQNDTVGLTKLMNDSHPSTDGSRVEITKDGKGEGYTFTRYNAKGDVMHTEKLEDKDELFSKVHAAVDPEKAHFYVSENRKAKADERKHADAMKRLDIALSRMATAGAKSKEDRADAAALRAVKQDVADRLKAGTIDWKQATHELDIASLKFGGQLRQDRAEPTSRVAVDSKATQEAIAKLIENNPKYPGMTPADQKVLRQANGIVLPGDVPPEGGGVTVETMAPGKKAAAAPGATATPAPAAAKAPAAPVRLPGETMRERAERERATRVTQEAAEAERRRREGGLQTGLGLQEFYRDNPGVDPGSAAFSIR